MKIYHVAVVLLFVCAMNASLVSAQVANFKEGSPDPFSGITYNGTEDAAMINRNTDTRNQNFGSRANFFVADTPTETDNSLIRFDITSMAGNFTSIDSVTLRLYYAGANPPSEMGLIEVFELDPANAAWIEGTGNGTHQSGSATWNELQRGFQGNNIAPNGSGTVWAGGSNGAGVSGTDHSALSLATYSVLGTEATNTATDFVFNDTSMIADWVAGTNAGLVLKSTGFDNSGFSWHSSDAGNAFHPELIIEFSSVPEPSGALLALVVLSGLTFRRTRR